MKNFLFASLIVVLLSGCAPTIVRTSFPDAPLSTMVPPPPLKPIKPVVPSGEIEINDNYRIIFGDTTPSDVTLSELIKKVTENYKISNVTRVQLEELQDWVRKQKKLNP